MKNLIFGFVTLIFFGINLMSDYYPITPRPLRALINESELIVIGKVIDTSPTKEENSWTSQVATISVIEVLQGIETNKEIQIYFSPGMVCPAPANYTKGATVLTFLDKHNAGYITHALSYGSKILNEEGLKLYKARIAEMLEINKEKNKSKKRLKVTNWLFECAKNKTTRWEGTYELSPGSDFMSSYDRNTEENKIRYILNSSQKNILRNILFEQKDIKYHDMGLIDLVIKGSSDLKMKEFLVDKLKNGNIENWSAEFIMSRINFVAKSGKLNAIIEELEEGYNFEDYTAEEKRREKLIKKFVESLKA